eukprot:m.24669 g.24669  ORF g.24669 m.24669 type:complete len:117 (-) comp7629_c0_seq2:53-403(-)
MGSAPYFDRDAELLPAHEKAAPGLREIVHPTEFYFACGPEDSGSICITPKRYYDTEGCWYDGHVDFSDGDFGPEVCPYACAESAFEPNEGFTMEQCRKGLIRDGFQENPALLDGCF